MDEFEDEILQFPQTPKTPWSFGRQTSTSYPSRSEITHSELESRNPSAWNPERGTELLVAAEKGDSDTVRRLLETTSLDADFCSEEDKRTALHRAAGYGHLAVVEILLKAEGNPLVQSAAGRTALHDACIGGFDRVVKVLVRYMKRGRALDTQDKDGQSACHLAAFHGELDCFNILADKGADCGLHDNLMRTPGHLAAMRNHPSILQSLFYKGINLQVTDSQGRSPIHYAAQHGGLEALVALIQCDCPTTVGDSFGCRPHHYAAAHNHVNCLRLLIKNGCHPEGRDGSGRTPAHMAAQYDGMTCLHWLLEKGINPNIQDDQGYTPLHYAGEAGSAECFNCCLQHDAELSIRNNRDDTALDTAKLAGHPVVIEKALKSELKCRHCLHKYNFLEWEKANQPSQVERGISHAGESAYVSPLPPAQRVASQLEKNRQKQQKSSAKKTSQDKKGTKSDVKLPRRDLATKYYGEHVGDIYKLDF
ncbi:uncharacterized protein LOC144906316 isoform X1 [Branchiostoma floridae x Branchiostoma belcheri]